MSRSLADTRECERRGCRTRRTKQRMVRLEDGSWRCPNHAREEGHKFKIGLCYRCGHRDTEVLPWEDVWACVDRQACDATIKEMRRYYAERRANGES